MCELNFELVHVEIELSGQFKLKLQPQKVVCSYHKQKGHRLVTAHKFHIQPHITM